MYMAHVLLYENSAPVRKAMQTRAERRYNTTNKDVETLKNEYQEPATCSSDRYESLLVS